MSLTHSFIHLFPLFFSYLIKSFLLSLYSAPLLSSHTYSNFFLFCRSPNSTFSPSYLLPFLLCLYSLCYYPILNVFFHTFSFLSPCLCPLPLMCSPICSESVSLFFLISHHSSFFSPTLSLSFALLQLISPSFTVLSVSILPQTLNRVFTSSCTTCVLSAMPSESQRQSGHIAWLSAPSTKTALR